MANEENKDNWNLYVLRYNCSGNYYVGTTPDFDDRMLIHWRRESTLLVKLPYWSKNNVSKKGFKFFWFNIEKTGVLRSYADLCENQLAKLLVKKIDEIKHENSPKEIHVGSGLGIDCKGHDREFEPIVSIDEKIEKYLKELKILETKDGEFEIKCCAIGYVGEYDDSQCNKSWKDVASIRFLGNHK